MATNYTFAEAVKVIAEGTDMEAMQDIGKRFPLLMHYVSKLVATSGTDFVEFASKLPAFLTALKVNSALKADGAEEPEGKEEAPVEEAGAEKIVEDNKKAETPKKGRRGRPKKNPEPVEVDDENEEEEDSYSGKTAKELFMLCKNRGIKAVPKKDSAFYAELLRKADAEEAKAKEAEDDDDWGDEEEPTEVEKKPSAKAKKEEPEDDDDDWDI